MSIIHKIKSYAQKYHRQWYTVLNVFLILILILVCYLHFVADRLELMDVFIVLFWSITIALQPLLYPILENRLYVPLKYEAEMLKQIREAGYLLKYEVLGREIWCRSDWSWWRHGQRRTAVIRRRDTYLTVRVDDDLISLSQYIQRA